MYSGKHNYTVAPKSIAEAHKSNTGCDVDVPLICTEDEPSISKNALIVMNKPRKIGSLEKCEYLLTHSSVVFSGALLSGGPTFEKHTFGARPFGRTTALNSKFITVFLGETIRHWHVRAAVVLNLTSTADTCCTLPVHEAICLAEKEYRLYISRHLILFSIFIDIFIVIYLTSISIVKTFRAPNRPRFIYDP